MGFCISFVDSVALSRVFKFKFGEFPGNFNDKDVIHVNTCRHYLLFSRLILTNREKYVICNERQKSTLHHLDDIDNTVTLV